MASAALDLVGEVAEPSTQGLGRLIGQYTLCTNFVALLRGIYELGQDLEQMSQQLSRYMSLTDDATQAEANSDGAVGAQLLAIGNVVGVTNYIPTPYNFTLTDAQFRLLIAARIYRNHVRGATVDQLIASLQIIMPDLTTGGLLTIVELDEMVTMVIVGREVELWEAGICSLTSGIARTRHGVLPKPSGVKIASWWWAEDCFTFADEDDITKLVNEDGVGFNTTESITEGIGRWPEDF